MPVFIHSRAGRSSRRWLVWVIAVALALGTQLPLGVARGVLSGEVDHLVMSEVVTGGTSASDELIELHNPTGAALPLEGLELIYVSASGATISRRALWSLGSPLVPSGGHVLVANAAGIYAPVADAVYASGMAATGGSVALRIQGASTAIDAVGWGTAAGTWQEAPVAPAPVPGASLERLPGGQLGSTTDTDDNLADFIERLVPEPQNLGSAPTPGDPGVTPSPEPSTSPIVPTPAPTAEPTVAPTPQPTPSSWPVQAISIATARAGPDGAIVTVEGVAITAHDFHDGGGFVADASAGIAVLVSDGTFARGTLLRVTGELDDRFAQRTLRATSSGIVALGAGVAPAPTATSTGAVNEALEGSIVRVTGFVIGSPSVLTSGVAFDLDDGSGPTRLVVDAATGIDVSSWINGTGLDLVGVAGQRDSSGAGTTGYRVMPRDGTDILGVTAQSASPTPVPSSSRSASPSASPPANGVIPIGQARQADKNARVVVRGTVTLPTGLVDAHTAAIQDASGAIVLRLGDDAGALAMGERVEVSGTRSTKSGMETIRVTTAPRRVGAAPDPAAVSVRSGDAGEANEAIVIVARGALVASARRSSKGAVSFDIDDGSGPLRVAVAASIQMDDEPLAKGTWVEVRGVLGQETTGSRPREGYRIWPRTAVEVRIVSAVTEQGNGGAGSGGSGGDGGSAGSDAPAGSLEGIGEANLASLRVGATLVAGPWKELGIGGVLWDGSHLVAVHEDSASLVSRIIGERPLPLSLDMGGLRARGTEQVTGVPLVSLGREADDVTRTDTPPSAPQGQVDGSRPAWVSLVGRLTGPASSPVLVIAAGRVALEERCRHRTRDRGVVRVTAIAIGNPVRLLVPCNGIVRAPSLDTAAGVPAAVSARTPAPLPAAAEVDAGRHSLPGILLLLAAGLLGSAAVARRTRFGGPAPDDPASDGAAEHGPPMEQPRLTLVRVRREHGP